MIILEERDLPGLNCGLCGSHTCRDFAARLSEDPALVQRCIHLPEDRAGEAHGLIANTGECVAARTERSIEESGLSRDAAAPGTRWLDSLGREFDFFLEPFPEDPGPREVILPHNPMLTREMDIREGDILVGRPLGMSGGCPITHCGEVIQVDRHTGVIAWCVTGSLGSTHDELKDIGYYIVEAFEGIIKETRAEIRLGARHYFQPRKCMLQWRHSGLINYLHETDTGLQVRLEGLWIG
jgi:uncharacterized Fe-S cluster-containing protein